MHHKTRIRRHAVRLYRLQPGAPDPSKHAHAQLLLRGQRQPASVHGGLPAQTPGNGDLCGLPDENGTDDPVRQRLQHSSAVGVQAVHAAAQPQSRVCACRDSRALRRVRRVPIRARPQRAVNAAANGEGECLSVWQRLVHSGPAQAGRGHIIAAAMSCPTLCDKEAAYQTTLRSCSPSKNTGVGCHFRLQPYN
ncbi:PP254 [Orf virus]|uniref:PP254 n=1 Tax=Orf virus TaxID=10258 RepID=F1AXE6_ORFV|nr:PP254 [Orf virus]